MGLTALRSAALVLGLALAAPAADAAPKEQAGIPTACRVPSALLQSRHSLPRTFGKLRRGEPVKIVAIGSSSTYGTGASGPEATYPSRLEADLRQLFPGSPITVVNRGIPGDTATTMLARFQRDVIDQQPDLMIWQTGTNSALRSGNIDSFTDEVLKGIRIAQAAHIDVMLLGPQYAPRFESAPNHMAFVRHLHSIADVRRVPLFPRYEAMKYWIQSGQFTFKTMIRPDGLHLTDKSYACLGRLVAQMIAGTRVETAGAEAQ